MNCRDCKYYQGDVKIHERIGFQCALTHNIIFSELCNLINKDLSNEKICYNCKYYLGGNDWGLSCAKHYHVLTEALHEGCEDFYRKDNKNEARN